MSDPSLLHLNKEMFPLCRPSGLLWHLLLIRLYSENMIILRVSESIHADNEVFCLHLDLLIVCWLTPCFVRRPSAHPLHLICACRPSGFQHSARGQQVSPGRLVPDLGECPQRPQQAGEPRPPAGDSQEVSGKPRPQRSTLPPHSRENTVSNSSDRKHASLYSGRMKLCGGRSPI